MNGFALSKTSPQLQHSYALQLGQPGERKHSQKELLN